MSPELPPEFADNCCWSHGPNLSIFFGDRKKPMLYTSGMKKSLLTTNPHLKDTDSRERALARNIESSSAVEGIWVKRDATSGRFVSNQSDKASTRVVKKKAQ